MTVMEEALTRRVTCLLALLLGGLVAGCSQGPEDGGDVTGERQLPTVRAQVREGSSTNRNVRHASFRSSVR